MHSQLSEQFSESQMAFRTTFIVTSGYLKTGTSFLKRVTGSIFRKLLSDFIKASRNFILNFLHNKEAKYSENHLT
jgi:hypothetical protein